MKKTFTLIELIVVIAVIGLLAAIIIPNISELKGKATTIAVVSDLRNLQTSIDMYAVENEGDYPSNEIPTDFIPQPINFDKLYPNYIRNFPKIAGEKYWVDSDHKVWASNLDAPTGIQISQGTMSWNEVVGAAGYNVYEVEGYQGVIGNVVKKNKLRFVSSVTSLSYTGEQGKAYVVSALDVKGNSTVPSGIGYLGYEQKEEPLPTNHVPTATIHLETTAPFYESTSLNWSVEATDPDGDTIVKEEWQLDGGEVLTTKPMGPITSIGSHTLKVRVQDSKGAWSAWSEKTLQIQEQPVYSTCKTLKENQPTATDGFYTIKPVDSLSEISVYCDMTTDGGGWTVVKQLGWGQNYKTGTFMMAYNPYGISTTAQGNAKTDQIYAQKYLDSYLDQSTQVMIKWDFSTTKYTSVPHAYVSYNTTLRNFNSELESSTKCNLAGFFTMDNSACDYNAGFNNKIAKNTSGKTPGNYAYGDFGSTNYNYYSWGAYSIWTSSSGAINAESGDTGVTTISFR